MLDEILKIVESNYFKSGDFNGTPIYRLEDGFDIHSEEFFSVVRKAIEDDLLTARSKDNPHIIAWQSFPTKETILERFNRKEDYPYICLYPHAKVLENSEYLSNYVEVPYSLELAKGAGQLDFRVFDMSVLEPVQNLINMW